LTVETSSLHSEAQIGEKKSAVKPLFLKEKIMNYEKIKTKLEKYNQEHLLVKYNELTENKKEELLKQISNINFEQIEELYKKSIKKEEKKDEKIEPIEYIDKVKLSKDEYNKYFSIGAEEIKKGKLGVVTMAGGQGTRLGHNGPKGTFMLGTTPNKSLFEILCDGLKRAKEQYGVDIPWYIMTSVENNKETVEFFEKNNYFDYPKENFKFFIQGELPMLNTAGKILLNEEGLVKQAADGHGGIFEAMFKNNVVEDMKSRGLEWLFIGPVDNPLVKMVDELLIGIAVSNKTMAAGKSLVKISPEEKVGVFCKKNGKPGVVEYTEISEEMANKKNQNGELEYGESHINCNMFNIKAIEEIGNNKLPYHSAFKKANYIDEKGEIVKAQEPNSFKYESFIFDAFEKLDKMTILRVKREEEFAPVKNPTGIDSAESARELYNKFHNI